MIFLRPPSMSLAKGHPGAQYRYHALCNARFESFPVPRSLGEGGCSMKITEGTLNEVRSHGFTSDILHPPEWDGPLALRFCLGLFPGPLAQAGMERAVGAGEDRDRHDSRR
jgi:hypothetical protein